MLVERKDIAFGGDAYYYHAGANLLTDGKGFISPFAYAEGRVIEAADHPPLYLMFLSWSVPSRDDERADPPGLVMHARHGDDCCRRIRGTRDRQRKSCNCRGCCRRHISGFLDV